MEVYTSPNIIIIVYPPGGFGYFYNYVMTQFFSGTIKIPKTENLYDQLGTTHNQHKCVDIVYVNNIEDYKLNIMVPYCSTDKIVLILESYTGNETIGNHNIYQRLEKKFPNAQIIKSVIDTDSVPVYHATSSNKTVYQFDRIAYINKWEDPTEDYSQREYWTLWFQSNPFNFEPILKSNIINVPLSKLVTNPVKTFVDLANDLELSITNLYELQLCCREWHRVQFKYFKILSYERKIKRSLQNDVNIDISHITSLCDQGYLNYCIERDFNITIPVYDYRNWFKNTNEIKEMIKCLK